MVASHTQHFGDFSIPKAPFQLPEDIINPLSFIHSSFNFDQNNNIQSIPSASGGETTGHYVAFDQSNGLSSVLHPDFSTGEKASAQPAMFVSQPLQMDKQKEPDEQPSDEEPDQEDPGIEESFVSGEKTTNKKQKKVNPNITSA